MSWKIIPYNHQYGEQWDQFVRSSVNGTMLHTRNFLGYHKNRFVDASLLIMEGEQILGVFPACEMDRQIISHFGSSYGSLVVDANRGMKQLDKMWRTIIDYFQNYKSIIIRSPERIFYKAHYQEIVASIENAGFKPYYEELSCAVDLTGDVAISKNRKDKIKRAEKKLSYSALEQDIGGFYEILASNLADKHNARPTHTLEGLKDLKKRLGNSLSFYSATYKNKMVAGICMLELIPGKFHTLYLCQDYEYKSYYPLSGLIGFAIDHLKSRGAQILNLGISNENQGNYLNEGLFAFKKSFGGIGIKRRTYILNYP